MWDDKIQATRGNVFVITPCGPFTTYRYVSYEDHQSFLNLVYVETNISEMLVYA
jgi:hypothetical protein